MRVLVTGASGFIGSAILRALPERGYTPRALVRATSPKRNLAGLDVETVLGDLHDPPSLYAALRGCDALIHVAADYRLWAPDAATMLRTNVDGTRALMRAAMKAGIGRIVYTSSVATLGLRDDGPADEDTPSALKDMIGPYKRSKFLAEQMVAKMVADDGLPAIIVNPSTPVGPGDIRPTPTGRVIVEAASGRMPAHVDTGLNLVHVDDVALGHVLALERGRIGQRYILGGEDMALSAMLDAIARHMGRPPPRFAVPLAAVIPVAVAAEMWAHLTGREPFVTLDGLRMARRRMFFTSAKAEDALGYVHRPAAEALAAAVQWFCAEGMVA